MATVLVADDDPDLLEVNLQLSRHDVVPGADDYLTKPFSMRALCAWVDEHAVTG